MKRNILSFILVLIAVSFTSCLEHDMRDLPLYEDADITSVRFVRYRYVDTGNNIDLNFTTDIDNDAGTIKIKATARVDFPASELDNLSLNTLVLSVNLSTAARIFPDKGSTAFGLPGDWSKPNTYTVEAANGTTKKWTVEVVELNK